MDTNKPITLNDLKSNSNEETTAATNVRVVNPTEILPESSKKDPLEEKMDKIMNDIDVAIERKKKEIDERKAQIEEELYEQSLEQETTATTTPVINLKNDETDVTEKDEVVVSSSDIEDTKKNFVPSSISQGSIFVDEEDFSDLDEEDDEVREKEEEEQLKAVKSVIKEKIKPITNVIDLSSFTISKKPVSVINALKSNMSSKKTVDWVLPATGIPVTMEALSGFEIQKLDPRSSSKNRFNTYREIYGILYDHIVDANKPKTIEEWVKLINFFDIDHIYFTAYKASFDGANSIPYSCPHCKEIFMEDIPIDNMIKYKDDESKKKVQAILQQDSTSPNAYDVELVQISDDYVIGFREPSIYNVIFENVVLDENFTEKYSELLSLLAYVDSIYYINREENALQPIELKIYPTNAVKTIKNRVVKYSQILQSLSSDQFYSFNAYIKAINERHDEMVYVLPEVTCPKCKTVIPEQEMSAETLLFTRHQLAGIANT